MTRITDEQVRRFSALFAGSQSLHGRWAVGADGQKQARTVASGPTAAMFRAHLEGEGAFLGIAPLREDSTVKFAALDVDDDGVDHAALVAKIAAHDLPLVVCRSKSGGAHLYLFLAEPVGADKVVEVMKRFRRALDYDRNADGRAVEIFPKQTRFEPGRGANWINLPYYDHGNTNRYAVAAGGDKLGLEAFLDVAERARVGERRLLTWADPSFGPFADGPPCLQQLHTQGFQSGGRNTALLNAGIFFKLSRPQDWQEALRDYNRENVPEPLDERELDQIIRSLEHNEYAYTCSQHPICQVCNKTKCKRAPYGIGFFIQQTRRASLPTLGNLVKVLTDPPRYRLKVDGQELSLSHAEFESPTKFISACLHKLNLVVEPPKPQEWRDLVKAMLAERTEEPAPEDAGDKGMMLTYLDDFLLQRFRCESIEDVLRSGYPALDENDRRVYFKAVDFVTFLRKRGFAKFDLPEIYAILVKETGMQHTKRELLGKSISLWSVPEPTNEQTEPFKPQKVPGAGY